MIVPKKSLYTKTNVSKFNPSIKLSKIPQSNFRTDRSPSHILKPSSAAPLSTDSPAIFDLNGRRVTETHTQDECLAAVEKNTDKESTPELVETAMATSSKEITRTPSEDTLPQVGCGIIQTIRKAHLETFQSHTVLDYIHDEDESRSISSERHCLRRIASQCSFVNICEGECRENKAKWGFSLATLFNVLMALMIMLLLAITLLVNYNDLVAIWYARKLKTDIFLPKEESYFDTFTNFLRESWMGLTNMIILDELDEDL